MPYNEFWYDRGNKIEGTKRTSLIVNPADGRLPPRTPEGQKRAEANAAAARNDQLGNPLADSWEDRPLQERCLMGFNAGPPMIPGAYNNNVQLLQTPEYVVILKRNDPQRSHHPLGRAFAREHSSMEWGFAGTLGG